MGRAPQDLGPTSPRSSLFCRRSRGARPKIGWPFCPRSRGTRAEISGQVATDLRAPTPRSAAARRRSAPCSARSCAFRATDPLCSAPSRADAWPSRQAFQPFMPTAEESAESVRRTTAPPRPSPRRPPSSRGRAQLMATSWLSTSGGWHSTRMSSATWRHSAPTACSGRSPACARRPQPSPSRSAPADCALPLRLRSQAGGHSCSVARPRRCAPPDTRPT